MHIDIIQSIEKIMKSIDSIDEFLPSPKEHMDEIFDAMMEGDNQ